MTSMRVGGAMAAVVVLTSSALLAIGGGAGASAPDQPTGASVSARGVSKPTISPTSGKVGTIVKAKGKCGNIGLGKILNATVGFYYKDAFSTAAGRETFHEVTIKGKKAKDYTAKLKVGPNHKYTTGSGAAPGPVVKHRPKKGDKLFVQTQCYYADTAYPQIQVREGLLQGQVARPGVPFSHCLTAGPGHRQRCRDRRRGTWSVDVRLIGFDPCMPKFCRAPCRCHPRRGQAPLRLYG